jgi:L-cysteine S-thiosulfotransferase
MMRLGTVAGREAGALPLPLAAEGWGGGVSAIDTPRVERAPTRRFAPTSPASGRGKASAAAKVI